MMVAVLVAGAIVPLQPLPIPPDVKPGAWVQRTSIVAVLASLPAPDANALFISDGRGQPVVGYLPQNAEICDDRKDRFCTEALQTDIYGRVVVAMQAIGSNRVRTIARRNAVIPHVA